MSLKQHKCQRELSHLITFLQMNKLLYILCGGMLKASNMQAFTSNK